VVEAILDCYQAERCSLRDAEAFIRQLSWREFVRLYFLRFGAGSLRAYERRPGFLGEPLAWTPIIALTEDDRSALLNIDHPTLPLFDRLKRAFWEHGYVHHTARFMAACFSSYLLGIDPRALYEIWRLWALDAHVETMCVNVWGMVVGGSFADPRFPPMMARQYVFQQPYLRRMALPSLLDGMTRDHWAVWNEGVRAAEARTHAYLQGEPRGEALYRQYRGLQYGRARARAYIDRGLHEPSVLEGIRSALLTH
jgi:hypothetical protein